MRWTVSVAGILCLMIAAVFIYTGIYASKGDQSEQAIREALKAQLKAVAGDLEDSLQKSQQIAESVAALDSKESKTGAQALLEQLEAPEMIMVREGKEVHEHVAGKFTKTIPVTQTMRRHFKSMDIWAYWQDLDRKPFLLYRGKKGESEFVAIFNLSSVFTRMSKGGAIRPWVALANGRIVYHSEQRYLGQKAANIRPIALGKQDIKKAQKIEMMAKYIGLEGDEVLGAWISSPAMQMIVGTEWPANWWGKKSSSYLTWIAAVLFFIGAFLIGYAITPRPVLVTEAKRELKDLSHEARTFIKKAEREVARAYDFARNREEEVSAIENQARDQLAYVKRTRWIFEKTESFLDDVMESPTEKDVWEILSRNLRDMAWKSPVLTLTYSNATHSLLPQSFQENNEFSESGSRYLSNARILVGDSRNLVNLETNGAYEMWLKRLQKHISLEGWRLFHLPFASQTGSKGIVIFFIREEIFDESEIARQRELWSLFAHRAAWLYDLKRRLIQSTYGSKRKQQHLAGPTDRING